MLLTDFGKAVYGRGEPVYFYVFVRINFCQQTFPGTAQPFFITFVNLYVIDFISFNYVTRLLFITGIK